MRRPLEGEGDGSTPSRGTSLLNVLCSERGRKPRQSIPDVEDPRRKVAVSPGEWGPRRKGVSRAGLTSRAQAVKFPLVSYGDLD